MKKKLISCLIILALCVSVFAGCARTNFGEEDLAKALKNLEAEMKLITGTTPSSYNVPNKLGEEYYITDADGNPATIYVEWKVEGSEDVTLKDNGDTTTVVIPANRTSAILYSLKATLVDENGKAYTNSNDETYTATFVCNAPVSSGGQDPQQPGGQDPQQPGGQEPGGQEPGGQEPQQPSTGTGSSKDSPYTVAQALEVISQREQYDYTDKVYVKGVVTGTVSTGSSGDYKFDIVDSGSSNKLNVYYANPNSYTVETGDTVVVSGALVNYGGTSEITAEKDQSKNVITPCAIESVTKGTGSGTGGGTTTPETPTPGGGTLESPYTVAQALEVISQRDQYDYTDKVYVKGVVTGTVSTGSSGDYKFDIVDSGSSNKLNVYYANPNGYTVATGDTVIVSGALVNYGGTSEITSEKDQSKNVITPCKIEGVTKGTGGGTGDNTGDSGNGSGGTLTGNTLTIDFTKQGYSDQAAISDISQDGIKIAFSKGSNNNAPKWFNNGNSVRFYGGNTITITGKTIVKVVLTFGKEYDNNEITTNVAGFETDTWIGSTDNLVFTIGGSTGNRRLTSIAITFAD